MKKITALFVSIILCFSISASASASVTSPAFPDIQGHPSERIIRIFAAENIVSGYPDGMFWPDRTVTRGELAKIATLAFDLTRANTFDYADAGPNDWFYDYLRYVSAFIPAREYDDPRFAGSFWGNINAQRIDIAQTLIDIIIYNENIEITLPPH